MDVEVAVPLRYPIPESELIRVRQTPRIENVACVVHVGEYTSIHQAYNAMLAWIETNDYRMTGPIREVYLRYGADGLDFELPRTYLADDKLEYVTELQIPVERR
jgi:effector-binding domain-containing protein